jgi:hypothetical protein
MAPFVSAVVGIATILDRVIFENSRFARMLGDRGFDQIGKVFLCVSCAAGSRCGWRGRTDRMCAKLKEIKEALRRQTNRPIPETGKWLAQVTILAANEFFGEGCLAGQVRRIATVATMTD